jgi:type IV pilus assembly protein PilM
VAISHEAIQRHREILDRLGIEPYAIEVGPLALVNAYLLGFHNPRETTVLLDIGASRTVIDIQRDGGIFFCRDLPISTAGFVREIQTRMGLSAKEIEEIKHGGTFSDEIDIKKMHNALQPGVDKLLMEIRRSLAFYDNVTGHLGFSRIFLSGGGALLPGLRESLEDNLDLPVQIMDPFEGIYWDEAKFPRGWMERTRPLWTVAVGLATRR